MGMKQILVMMAAVLALVGCSNETPEPSPASDPAATAYEKLIADPIAEKAVRKSLKKPEGELTAGDLEKVTRLILADTQITDVGLKEVAKLQKLKQLYLQRTKITDAGLKEVAHLQQLTYLELYGTQITDAGLKEVAKLQQLKNLFLEGTQITDEGLKEVAKLQQLE